MPFRHLPGVETCRFAPREVLIRRGEAMPYVYYLIRGTVKREVVTAEGSVMIMTIKESGKITGSIVGLLGIYDAKYGNISPDDFIAENDCICYRIPVEVCKAYLRAHPILLEEALIMCLALFDEVEDRHKQAEVSAPARLCEFLLLHSEERPEGSLLAKKYSNVELAKYIDAHSVTVSRIIACLQREGFVTRSTHGLCLTNIAELKAIANGKRKIKYD
ncbi:MAG: Crp/Fnr family transcriptional regulator [Peptococcaceae bacterium]|nr:Crp/Fnr family transcriptional regulator [Peptococcaceae bacterium]